VSTRLVSADVLRGLVLFLLLPDLEGGFSFYRVAEQFPDSRLWTALARTFTHAPWSGATVWDFIMPCFVFVVGLAMSFSAAARIARGETRGQVMAHLLLRVTALFLMSLLLRLNFITRIDELWPPLLLAVGLPIPAMLARALNWTARTERGVFWVWWIAILGATAVHIAFRFSEIQDQDLFGPILSQLALASLLAFALVGRPLRVQLVACAAALLAYWLWFALYPLPPAGFDPATAGVSPADETFTRFFAHWNKNTNAAWAFDVWFLNLLPRSVPFAFNKHGLVTLNFVTTAVSMSVGVMVGDLLRSKLPRAQTRNTLIFSGAAMLAAGVLAGFWVCPLVKSIWTPSWVLFSSGIVVLLFAGLYELCDVQGRGAWAFPFVVLGANSLLLYVLSWDYRWWFLVHFAELWPGQPFSGPYQPLTESIVFLGLLWGLALVLYRMKIFIRM
jgi:heparan-alpha-glucosaminide N-acetyltransferase